MSNSYFRVVYAQYQLQSENFSEFNIMFLEVRPSTTSKQHEMCAEKKPHADSFVRKALVVIGFHLNTASD